MNIRGRLFMQGALLPATGIVGLVLIGGAWFRSALILAVDESLSAQAAVEMVSLFDDDETAHIHLSRSPLRGEVANFAAAASVYDADGKLVLVQPPESPFPERIDSQGPLSPEIATVNTPMGEARELRVGVISPKGERFTLILWSVLSRIDHAVNTWFRIAGFGSLLVIALLCAVQIRASRWWSERIHNMIRHTRRLEAGDLSSRPDPDSHGDEIGELTVAIAHASERLEVARRAQDRLVADAAHELRTPLAAIRAEIEVTLRRPRDEAALRETLEEVRQEVLRLDELSTQLLDLARLANGAWQFEVVNLRALLDEVIENQRPIAEAKGLRIEVDGTERIDARVDTSAIRQVFDNLLSNAIKFSAEGQTVTLRLERSESRWLFSVRDEGPGVPAEERSEVFEPFRRRDTRIRGAGLGLAIVRDVARGHRGAARLEDNAPGTRAVFEAPIEP